MIVHGYDLSPLEPMPEDGDIGPGWSLDPFVCLEEVTPQALYDRGARYFQSTWDTGMLTATVIDGFPAKSFFCIYFRRDLAKPDALG